MSGTDPSASCESDLAAAHLKFLISDQSRLDDRVIGVGFVRLEAGFRVSAWLATAWRWNW